MAAVRGIGSAARGKSGGDELAQALLRAKFWKFSGFMAAL